MRVNGLLYLTISAKIEICDKSIVDPLSAILNSLISLSES